jgi:hypothetical protein
MREEGQRWTKERHTQEMILRERPRGLCWKDVFEVCFFHSFALFWRMVLSIPTNVAAKCLAES